MTKKLTWTKRNGLSESLESYASRTGQSPHAARLAWRIFGITLLRGDLSFDEIAQAVTDQGSRCAPDISVPTRAPAEDRAS